MTNQKCLFKKTQQQTNKTKTNKNIFRVSKLKQNIILAITLCLYVCCLIFQIKINNVLLISDTDGSIQDSDAS
jgi:hypothetical protein